MTQINSKTGVLGQLKKRSKKHLNPKALSAFELRELLPDEESARKWLEGILWPEGPKCPHCGSSNVQCGISHTTQTHRCRDCKDRRMFSLKTGTTIHRSKLSYQQWALAIHEVVASQKGVSSIKLGKILGIPQNTVWRLKWCIIRAFDSGDLSLKGMKDID